MFKMSKIHQNLGEAESRFEKLHLASKILQADRNSPRGMDLQRQIESEMAQARHIYDR